MAGPIRNASAYPLTSKSGTTPDVSGAMQDYFQPMVFTTIKKTVSGFQVLEAGTPINFQGNWQPFTPRALLLKPEGQRSWTWYELYADPVLTLETDSVVIWQNKQTRIMSRQDFGLYGYVVYHLVQDWIGMGPL